MKATRDANARRYHSRVPAFLLLIAMSCAVAATTASAQTPAKKAPSKSLSARVAEQKKAIEAQTRRIEEQQALIDAQKQAADSLASRNVELGTKQRELVAELEAMKQRLAELENKAGLPAWDALDERLKEIEAAARKQPELPPDVVSAGDFPGSIRIPGTDAAVKFGGRIRTAVVLTLDPLGTDDRFLTNSIPVGGSEVIGDARRTNISARASALNVEFRTPSGTNQLRAFFEGDFAGEANGFRLRHAYMQYAGWIIGQTWSTFSDPNADPEDLDFEGVSSENVTRQPLVRYTKRPRPTMRAAAAIETPAVSITGGAGVNLFPDVIARLNWGYTQDGHLQGAAVLRQIRGQAPAGDVRSDWAYGGSLSGVLPFNFRPIPADRIIFQVNGGVGIARYINDLSSLGGQDAVFDTTTVNLEALPALGWYVAYEHNWKIWDAPAGRRLRSTFLWSFVRVYNLDFQAPDAYQRTHRVMANVVFSPFGRVDTGVEFIRGSRTNKDGQKGEANQFQFVMLCRF